MATLRHNLRNISDVALLDDLRRVAGSTDSATVRQRDYKQLGNYGVTTVIRRFGGWNAAIERAGIIKTVDRSIPDQDLIDEIHRVWKEKGTQPVYGDFLRNNTKYHATTIARRFKSWYHAIKIASETLADFNDAQPKTSVRDSRKQIRSRMTERLRFKILKRDRFRCVLCGASPANDGSVELHVDHIIPFSKGGQSDEKNLRSLCSRCNYGKSDQ
ncbi:MAG: hypothetical protein COB40_04410 [Marinosulfonomonas sp.]|nr:MAG: hypothetical protein COB40_04410 [Marinosulfonomonas sp.]